MPKRANTPSESEAINWEDLANKIGPLRYQTSNADCVPTTIINGLLVVYRKPLHPKLQSLIWGLSLDAHERGTGWVTCQTLSDLITNWTQLAAHDLGTGKRVAQMPVQSRIWASTDDQPIALTPKNALMRCLNAGGVACVTVGKGADHYALLLGQEGADYLVFDPDWWPQRVPQQADFAKYGGLVNTRWTRGELEENVANGWIHLLTPGPIGTLSTAARKASR